MKISHAIYPQRANQGFSLIELLAVVSIMSIVLVFSIPAVSAKLEALRLTNGRQAIEDIMSLARQAALTRNRSVAVRFYMPANGPHFTGLQTIVLQDDGTEEPLGRPSYLPDGIIISDQVAHSNLPQTSPGTVQLPGRGSMKYSELRFRRDGSTNLDPSKLWFFSLIYAREDMKNAPSNFFTFLIEPNSGVIKVVRP